MDIPKDAYWTKKCLFNEKVSVERKCTYWMKMCLLNDHSPLGINSCHIYMITSSYWSFLETKTQKKTYRYSPKLIFIIFVCYINRWKSLRIGTHFSSPSKKKKRKVHTSLFIIYVFHSPWSCPTNHKYFFSFCMYHRCIDT